MTPEQHIVNVILGNFWEIVLPVQIVLLWLLFEFGMIGASWKRKLFVRVGLSLFLAFMFDVTWNTTDVYPDPPKPPKGPALIFSCQMSPSKSKVTVFSKGVKPDGYVSAFFIDANGPSVVDCKYNIETPN